MSDFQAGMLACAVAVLIACLGVLIAVVGARRRSWDEFRARQDRTGDNPIPMPSPGRSK